MRFGNLPNPAGGASRQRTTTTLPNPQTMQTLNLANHQILKLHPVLRQFGEQWATHFYNDQDGGFHHGHYFATLDKAEADFLKRVAQYSPTE